MSHRTVSNPKSKIQNLKSPRLARSAVHRRLPAALRAELDAAILHRPKELPTLEAIAGHFDLPKYHISPAALRSYARRLEDLSRPAVAGQFVAALCAALPDSGHDRTLDGAELLLVSRLVKALTRTPWLSTADLARFCSMIAALARPHLAAGRAGAKRTLQSGLSTPQTQPLAWERTAKAVQNLYGITLPTPLPPDQT